MNDDKRIMIKMILSLMRKYEEHSELSVGQDPFWEKYPPMTVGDFADVIEKILDGKLKEVKL